MRRSVGKQACILLLVWATACSQKEQPSKPMGPETRPLPEGTVTMEKSAEEAQAGSENTPMQIAENMIDALARNDLAAAMKDFDSTMRGSLTEVQLRQVWAQLTEQNGAFQKRLNGKVERIQGYDAVFINCQFERDTLALQVTVDQEGQVSGFFIRPKF